MLNRRLFVNHCPHGAVIHICQLFHATFCIQLNLNECLTSFDFWLVGANHTFNSNLFFCILAVYIMCMSDNMIHRIPYDFNKQLIMKTTHKIRQVYHTFCVLFVMALITTFLFEHTETCCFISDLTLNTADLYMHIWTLDILQGIQKIFTVLQFHFVMPHPYSKRD